MLKTTHSLFFELSVKNLFYTQMIKYLFLALLAVYNLSGLLVLSPTGKLLGRIESRELIVSCVWSDDGSTLLMTIDAHILVGLKPA